MSACIPCEQLSNWPTTGPGLTLTADQLPDPPPPYYTPKLFSTVLHESQEWSQTGLPWRNSVWRRKTFTHAVNIKGLHHMHFMRVVHCWLVDSPHKWPVVLKTFHVFTSTFLFYCPSWGESTHQPVDSPHKGLVMLKTFPCCDTDQHNQQLTGCLSGSAASINCGFSASSSVAPSSSKSSSSSLMSSSNNGPGWQHLQYFSLIHKINNTIPCNST